MTLKEATTKISENWSNIKRGDNWSHEFPVVSTKEGIEALWLSVSDKADAYEVNEEWVGVRPDGKMVWAYASGCSCWDGDYEVHEFHAKKEFKVFEFNHDVHKDVNWNKRIITFAQML